MNIPSELKYTKDHEWVRIEDDNTITVGITDFAQGELGDLVYVEVETLDETLDAEEVFGTVEAVKTEEFSLVLMDVEMPDMDGIKATKIIRELDTQVNTIPIIAVTAHSSMKDREKCLASGMNDYIAKPININFMKMTIDQWLK